MFLKQGKSKSATPKHGVMGVVRYLDCKPLGTSSLQSLAVSGKDKDKNSPAQDTPYAVEQGQKKTLRESRFERLREKTYK
jgi:hypothetical protein